MVRGYWLTCLLPCMLFADSVADRPLCVGKVWKLLVVFCILRLESYLLTHLTF